MRLVRDTNSPRTYQAEMQFRDAVKSDIQSKVSKDARDEGKVATDIKFSITTENSPVPIEEYIYSKIDL